MLVVMTTNGTRGDVQPYVGLAVEMAARGHEVRVCAPRRFSGMVTERGLEFHPTRADLGDFVEELAKPGGGNFLRLMLRARSILSIPGGGLAEMFEDFAEACHGADAVVYGPLSYPGRKVAQALGATAVACAMQPMFYGTALYRSSVMPDLPDRCFLDGRVRSDWNRLTYQVARAVFWGTTRKLVNEGCEALNLGPEPWFGVYDGVASSGEPWLNAWSPAVLPPAPEWPLRMHTTGYWFLDASAGWEPPEELKDFLAAGDPPVCVGFGSMRRDVERSSAIVLEALKRAGLRGVVLSGAGGIEVDGGTEDIVSLKEAPHDWLLERCSVMVHHGGAGTTAAAFRAGVPMVTVNFMADQRFWGDQAKRLGVAARPFWETELEADVLSAALRQTCSDARMRRKAAELSSQIRGENGVGTAARIIEERVARSG